MGPVLTPLLFDVLLQFRMNPIALIADVQKAFHQFEICEKDRDSLRFLWSEDQFAEPLVIKEYRFTRVIFGSAPSPVLLNATFQKHLESYEEIDKEFVENALSSFYVDDHLGSTDSVKDAIEIQRKLSKRMEEGGFNLHKWKSNSREVMDALEKQGVVASSSDQTTGEEPNKVLGIHWDPEKDTLSLDMSPVLDESSKKLIKHEMLSSLAKIYDLLGLIGPSVVQGKIAFQEACKEAKGWDVEPSDEVQEKWQRWKKGIRKESQISFLRYIAPNKEDIRYHLHVFADSSKVAYCATVYQVCELPHQIYSNVVAAKTRLPPLKKELSIPRLELTAARIASRLSITVKEALSKYKIEDISMWSDSCTVLHWINGKGKYKQFVDHRVKEINSILPSASWRYCPTMENPADFGTRGKTPTELSANELWWQGPEWLCTERWPDQPFIDSMEEPRAEEVKSVTQIQSREPKVVGLSSIIDLGRYSSKEKLLKVTAWVRRFINACKSKERVKSKGLTVDEIVKAELEWIKEVQ